MKNAILKNFLQTITVNSFKKYTNILSLIQRFFFPGAYPGLRPGRKFFQTIFFYPGRTRGAGAAPRSPGKKCWFNIYVGLTVTSLLEAM